MAAATRVYLHTLGCPKNDADTSVLARRLAGEGVTLVSVPEQATHLLINTCGFTQEAKEESIGAILDAADAYPAAELLVMGCLVERYRRELVTEIPEVTAWFGLGDQDALVGMLERRDVGETMQARGGGPPPSSTPGGVARSFAYVKISDGCDHPCTFCAIPGIKGPYRGLSAAAILAEARAALDEGARELVLVGQDTAIWEDGDLRLADLLDGLAADPRVRWIRLLYLQPEHVDEGLLRLLAGHEKVVPYLDIPFQHASGAVLRRMARGGDGESHLALLRRARTLMPEVSIRSTFIVGFPGETEEDLDSLLQFVAEAGFAHAGAFVYSPEEGTKAARLRPRIPTEVARERLTRLSSLLLDLAEERNADMAGRHLQVMIDVLAPGEADTGAPEGAAVGRTVGQAPEIDGVTVIEGPLPVGLAVGDVISAEVVDAVGYDLVARWDGP
jgi:ribosomal protein S12 methylthiotransferase